MHSDWPRWPINKSTGPWISIRHALSIQECSLQAQSDTIPGHPRSENKEKSWAHAGRLDLIQLRNLCSRLIRRKIHCETLQRNDAKIEDYIYLHNLTYTYAPICYKYIPYHIINYHRAVFVRILAQKLFRKELFCDLWFPPESTVLTIGQDT